MGRKIYGQWLKQIIYVFITPARAHAVLWSQWYTSLIFPSQHNKLSSSLPNVWGENLSSLYSALRPETQIPEHCYLQLSRLIWYEWVKQYTMYIQSYLTSQCPCLQRDGNWSFSEVVLEAFINLLHAMIDKTGQWWYNLFTWLYRYIQNTQWTDML